MGSVAQETAITTQIPRGMLIEIVPPAIDLDNKPVLHAHKLNHITCTRRLGDENEIRRRHERR
jgi:hypothetical protein